MDIIKCPNCGQDVSRLNESCQCGLLVCSIVTCHKCGQPKMKSAPACSSCGYKRPAPPPKNGTSATTLEEDLNLLDGIVHVVSDILHVISDVDD